MPTDPRVSVGVESALAAPFALAYILVSTLGGHGHFLGHGAGHVALTVLCGPITAIPLLCFGGAATRVSMTTLGLLQYLTPTLQFLCGVLVFHEPMSAERWAGFALVWVALMCMSFDAVRGLRSGEHLLDSDEAVVAAAAELG